MSWYVRYDDSGVEVERKKAGRGRPPKGWTRIVEEDSGGGGTATSTEKKEKYFWIKRDPSTGALLEHKSPQRGRMPKGWEKITGAELLPLLGSSGEGVSTEANTEASTDAVSHVEEVEEKREVISSGKKYSTKTDRSEVTTQVTLEALQKAVSHEENIDPVPDNVTSWVTCHITDRDLNLQELIDIEDSRCVEGIVRMDIMSNGDIHIWCSQHTGAPDVILEEAISD